MPEQRLDEMRDRLHQVLAVVEQQQLLAIADVPGERDLRGAVGGKPRVQGLGDRRPDQLGLAERRQLHRPDAVGEVVSPLPGQLQGESRLAAATRPGQRQQPARCAGARRASASPRSRPMKLVELPRKVVWAPGRRSHRGCRGWAHRFPFPPPPLPFPFPLPEPRVSISR